MPAEILPTMSYFALLLGFGVIVSNMTNKWKMPNALFLLLVGLLFGPSLLGLVDIGKMGDVPEFLRTLALIVIVFAGTFRLKMSTFKRVSKISLKLAFGGFFISTLVLGVGAHWIFGLSWIGSFILSSIVGGTSSAAIMTFQDTLGERGDVGAILTIESIFSDPLTVLVPILLLEAYMSGIFSSTIVMQQFWQLIAAGVGTGVVVGLAVSELFKKTDRKLSPILSFAIALVTYALASNVGGSGILAVAITALILGNRNIPYKDAIGEFEDTLSTMLTISIFTFLGAQITLIVTNIMLFQQAVFIALAIFLVRPAITFLLTRNKDYTMFDKLLMAMTGPRGAATAAVAAVPLTYAMRDGLEALVPEANIILLTAFFVIFFTMLSSTIANVVMVKNGKKKKAKEEEL
jgi:cell volume regulation protein A|tara:strand:+ start:8147 stop:9361 length:1215 start_codon:yes stop_codon:yes gene_type:complete